jgi:hypothetical protein
MLFASNSNEFTFNMFSRFIAILINSNVILSKHYSQLIVTEIKALICFAVSIVFNEGVTYFATHTAVRTFLSIIEKIYVLMEFYKFNFSNLKVFKQLNSHNSKLLQSRISLSTYSCLLNKIESSQDLQYFCTIVLL